MPVGDRSPDLPFAPKSNAHLRPGHIWDIPLGDGGHACGVVLISHPTSSFGARTIILAGLLDWWGADPPTPEAVVGRPVIEMANVGVGTIVDAGGKIIGEVPLLDAPPAAGEVTRLVGSLDQLAELRWGARTAEPPHVVRAIRSGKVDAALEGDASPLGNLTVQLPLTDLELATAGDWAARHPLVSCTFKAPSRAVTDLEFLRAFPTISTVGIWAPHVTDLRGLRHLGHHLESLALSGTDHRRDLTALGRFGELRELTLTAKRADLRSVAALPSLESLTLDGFRRPDLSPLASARRLGALAIRNGALGDPGQIAALPHLWQLSLGPLTTLVDLSWLTTLPRLDRLGLFGLPRVTALPDLTAMTGLTKLAIWDLKRLADLRPIASAPALEMLRLGGEPGRQVDDLRFLVGHPTLQAASIRTGHPRRDREVQALLGLPPIPA